MKCAIALSTCRTVLVRKFLSAEWGGAVFSLVFWATGKALFQTGKVVLLDLLKRVSIFNCPHFRFKAF